MSEIRLPSDIASAEKYERILQNLIERYLATQEPVDYKETALQDISKQSSSSALKYFFDLGLLDSEKQGVYTPKEELVELYSTDYDETSEAWNKVREILANYEILNEAEYLLSQDHDLEELAADVISLEEDLEEDDEGEVKRAIDIFSELNIISPRPDSINVEEKEDITGSGPISEEVQFEIDSDSISLEIGDLPKRSDPERLRTISDVMEAGGEWSRDNIEEEEEVEMNRNYISGTLDYGEKLGFINSSDDGSWLSEKGFELYYNKEDKEKVQKLYREAIGNFSPYMAILNQLVEDGDHGEGDVIENKDVLNTLRTDFGLTQTSSDAMKRAATTLFDTLEVAGFGERLDASGSLPTRFRLHDDVTLENVLKEISSLESTPDIEKEKSESSEIPLSEEKGSNGHHSERPDQTDDFSPQTVESESLTQDEELEKLEAEGVAANINIDINITINPSEMDTAEFEAKMEVLERLLK